MEQVDTLQPFRERNVGDIAANVAGATGVFRQFGIDFCCHGDVPLDEAARRGGIELAAVEEALSGLDVAPPADLPEDTAELTD
jgi:regulator of cell morphogenesis and NO signaling